MAKKKKSQVAPTTTPTMPTPNTIKITQDLARLDIGSPSTPTLPYQTKKTEMANGQLGKKKKEKRDIVREFDTYFGNTSKLENWQRLCADLGLEGDLGSVRKCRGALRSVWINIYDFLDEKKTGKKAIRFKSEAALAAYTIKHDKIYPKAKAKEGGPVRALLAHIFH